MVRAWLGAIFGILAASAAQSADVRDVRLWRAPDHTRIVLDLSAPAEHKLFVLENPTRIVLDVEDAQMATAFPSLKIDNTPIKSIRSGVREGDDLRIVFDMGAAVSPRSFALKANEQAGDRLVVDLYDQGAPSGGAAESVAALPEVKKRAGDGGKRDIIIAIDAGHGGEDPGAIGPSRKREKDVVLAISKELQSLFAAEPGFTPTLIRSGDYYVSLAGRRELARKRQADLFVSIHADAFTSPKAYGASVYALSLSGATSTTARYLAQRENASDLVGGVNLGDHDDVLAGVLADLSMTSTLDTSLQVGSYVLRNMGGLARLHKRNVEQAGFAVLKSPDIPSILVETGFISNPDESRKLATSNYQKQMARAIYSGIHSWFTAHPPSGTLVAWNKAQGGTEYIIARGDTLSDIAQRFNVSLNSLMNVNGIDGSRIIVGQKLTIPAS
ncbi:N-acetylmuramoyl-L-alanine amidase [Haliea sp. E17]|uniref:N-acetylmuramoyl-L-alanine amidase n=1 Tax=Haliea sp. E17 TaxID=3401576 RepID=UPI003AAD163E